MDVLTVVMQYSMVHECKLDMVNIATLKCVSINTKLMVEKYIDETIVLDASANTIGIPYKTLPREHAINMNIFLKQLLTTKRLYGKLESNDKQKFKTMLNHFTSQGVNNVWSESICGLPLQKQIDTISFLLGCVEKNNIQHNVMIVYFLMQFIFKLINTNKTILKDKEKFLLQNVRLQQIIQNKCNEISTTLREEITMYPFAFVDRVIRKVGEVKRLVLSLAR